MCASVRSSDYRTFVCAMRIDVMSYINTPSKSISYCKEDMDSKIGKEHGTLCSRRVICRLTEVDAKGPMGKGVLLSTIVCALALHCAWSYEVAIARLEFTRGSGIDKYRPVGIGCTVRLSLIHI